MYAPDIFEIVDNVIIVIECFFYIFFLEYFLPFSVSLRNIILTKNRIKLINNQSVVVVLEDI